MLGYHPCALELLYATHSVGIHCKDPEVLCKKYW